MQHSDFAHRHFYKYFDALDERMYHDFECRSTFVATGGVCATRGHMIVNEILTETLYELKYLTESSVVWSTTSSAAHSIPLSKDKCFLQLETTPMPEPASYFHTISASALFTDGTSETVAHLDTDTRLYRLPTIMEATALHVEAQISSKSATARLLCITEEQERAPMPFRVKVVVMRSSLTAPAASDKSSIEVSAMRLDDQLLYPRKTTAQFRRRYGGGFSRSFDQSDIGLTRGEYAISNLPPVQLALLSNG